MKLFGVMGSKQVVAIVFEALYLLRIQKFILRFCDGKGLKLKAPAFVESCYVDDWFLSVIRELDRSRVAGFRVRV